MFEKVKRAASKPSCVDVRNGRNSTIPYAKPHRGVWVVSNFDRLHC